MNIHINHLIYRVCTSRLLVSLVLSWCGVGSYFADKLFHELSENWKSNVQSYRYRFVIINNGNPEDLQWCEASGDEKDHTLVIYYDKLGNEVRRLISNPIYTAIIGRTESNRWIIDSVLIDDHVNFGESRWMMKRGIDPFHAGTHFYFTLRSYNTLLLEGKERSDVETVWQLSSQGPFVTNNPPGFPDSDSCIRELRVTTKNERPHFVTLVTEMQPSETGAKFVVERTAEFNEWELFSEAWLPLQVKFFDEQKRPYVEYRIQSREDVHLNDHFDIDSCYLRGYGLPDPAKLTAGSNSLPWYLWCLIGAVLILIPIYWRRTKKSIIERAP